MTLAELQSKARFLLFRDSTNTTYADSDITTAVNQYYQELTGIILANQGQWEMKSTYATKNLEADENEYLLPSDLIALERVEVNYSGTSDGWMKMDVTDMRDMKDALSNDGNIYEASNPHVRVFDFSIFLHPTPETNVASGLKIYFSQEQTTLSESTDEPDNLPKLAQMYLVYGACLDFAIAGENSTRTREFENLMAKSKAGIIEYYANRLPAKRTGLRIDGEDNNY